MINNDNNTDKKDTIETPEEVKPDEKSGLFFQGFLKITDPETGEILAQGRA